MIIFDRFIKTCKIYIVALCLLDILLIDGKGFICGTLQWPNTVFTEGC